jgi:Fe-S-cluster formation regulator IscX/YfhJ
MSEREQNIFDMFKNTAQFDVESAADYASIAEAAARFTSVRSVIANLENFTADRASGARGQAVEQKSVIRAAIRRKMTDYARTARALNIDDPGFRRLFRVPDNNNDEGLIAAAREFVEEARRFENEFASLGIAKTYADALEDDIDALEAAMTAKTSAQLEGVGATAGIDAEIDKGMDDEKVLDAIMRNVYRDNPVKLAQWMTARHVRRINPKAKDEPVTSPPTP